MSPPMTRSRPVLDLVCLLGGIGGIVVGADLLVSGAVTVARSLRSQRCHCRPHHHRDRHVRTRIRDYLAVHPAGEPRHCPWQSSGSSVYNLALILGLTILFAPTVVEVPAEVLGGDLVLMTAGAIACVPVFLSGRRVSRIEGGLFVAAYCALYLAWLLVVRA